MIVSELSLYKPNVSFLVLLHIGVLLRGTQDPTKASPLTALIPPDSKTCYVKVYVFIFLWENHDVVRLGPESRVTQSLDPPGEMPFHREPTVPNLDQD